MRRSNRSVTVKAQAKKERQSLKVAGNQGDKAPEKMAGQLLGPEAERAALRASVKKE